MIPIKDHHYWEQLKQEIIFKKIIKMNRRFFDGSVQYICPAELKIGE